MNEQVFTQDEIKRLRKMLKVSGKMPDPGCMADAIDSLMDQEAIEDVVAKLGFHMTAEGNAFLEAMEDAEKWWRIMRGN